MSIPNRITLAQLTELDANEIANAPVDQLLLLQDEIAAKEQKLKKMKACFMLAVNTKYAKRAAAMRQKERKNVGIIHLEDSGYDITCDAPKKVDWDQKKLETAFDKIPEGWEHYAQYKLSVGEDVYKNAPPSVKKLLEPCRTESTGTEKFTIKAIEGKGK